MDSHCPKCGSSQILNDECLKCGVIISKAHSASPPQQGGTKPVSYVAPPAQASSAPASYTWRPPTMQGPLPATARDVKRLQRSLIWTIISLLVLGGIYQIYQYFIHQAAAYGGYYRNTYHFFSLNFPEKGWSHYDPGALKAIEFKDAKDAFYRGKNPDNPQVVMAVWTEHIDNPVPERLDSDTAGRLKRAIEDEIIKRMKKASMECRVTDSAHVRIGGNDGLVIHADLLSKDVNMKTIIYCAF